MTNRAIRIAGPRRMHRVGVLASVLLIAGLGGANVGFGAKAVFAQSGNANPMAPRAGGVFKAGDILNGLCRVTASSSELAVGQATPVAPAATESYSIQVEDTIDISVADHDMNRSYVVPPDGVIEPPVGGEINVKGMTVKELRARLTKAFSKRFFNPEVIVNVRPVPQTVNVFIAGKGEKLALRAGAHVFDVVAAAGGLPYPRPEAFKATLFRTATAQVVQIDVDKLFKNDPENNVTVESGDTVYVEEKEPVETTIQVLGEVQKPGPIIVPRDHSMVTVLQTVGGPTPSAELSDVVVEHDGKQSAYDMRNYRQTGFEAPVKLEAGDKLIVKTNRNEFYVYGAFQRTGTQIYPDESLPPAIKPLTLSKAIANLGGSTEGVDLSKVSLTHTAEDGSSKTMIVDVHQMIKTGDYSHDPPVAPGDKIFVPPSSSPHGIQLNQVLGVLGSLGGAIALYQLFHH